MSSPEEHSSFIKTPLQLIVVILLAFLVPIIGILLVVELVLNQTSADPAALKPKAVAQRLQPVGRIELVSTAPAAAGMRSGEQIVNTACGARHELTRRCVVALTRDPPTTARAPRGGAHG
jgi:hypothetical protein